MIINTYKKNPSSLNISHITNNKNHTQKLKLSSQPCTRSIRRCTSKGSTVEAITPDCLWTHVLLIFHKDGTLHSPHNSNVYLARLWILKCRSALKRKLATSRLTCVILPIQSLFLSTDIKSTTHESDLDKSQHLNQHLYLSHHLTPNSGVPNPRAAFHYWAMACLEPDHASGWLVHAQLNLCER